MNTATKPTASEVMYNQDRIDAIITQFNKATTTQEQRAQLQAEYNRLEARNALYFNKNRKK